MMPSSFPEFRTAARTGLVLLIAASLQGRALAQANNYEQTILVANRAEYRPVAFVDKYLVNPWGIALRPPGKGGHIWISNARNATTSTYIGDVNGIRLHQGDVLTSPGGSVHRESWSAEGCELVIECSPSDELLRS